MGRKPAPVDGAFSPVWTGSMLLLSMISPSGLNEDLLSLKDTRQEQFQRTSGHTAKGTDRLGTCSFLP